MRLKYAVATLAVLSLPVGSAMADSFWRNVISSGATTGSTYLTFKDHKLVVAAQDDAGSFVASDGGIRGPYLEAAMQKVRADNPGLQATDMELANAILANFLHGSFQVGAADAAVAGDKATSVVLGGDYQLVVLEGQVRRAGRGTR